MTHCHRLHTKLPVYITLIDDSRSVDNAPSIFMFQITCLKSVTSEIIAGVNTILS